MPRAPDFKLLEAIRAPGFTPGRADINELLDHLSGDLDDETNELAQRALLRAGAPARRAILARAPSAPPPAKRALTSLLGRAASANPDAEDVRRFLITTLEDADPKTRRNAAIALGKLHHPEVEEALAARLEREDAEGPRRSIIAALGKVGGRRALSALEKAGEAGGDEVIDRARARSTLMVTRTLDREAPSTFDVNKEAPADPPGGARVALRCRSGLEEILKDELENGFDPRIERDDVAGARVEVTLKGAPASLFQARTMTSFGFLLPPQPVSSPDRLPEALAESLSSPDAKRILTHWTRGAVRYRIAWARGGKRRAAIWRTAEEVSLRCPELVNDPRESTWHAIVHEGPGVIRVELEPRFDDPRFVYRRGDVPAASHPTIAAALVRVAGVRADDVVWDPFVGSGGELCERAIAGPYLRLIGSDKDERALEIARVNLAAAGARADLIRLDIHSRPALPARPTLVITNPPMGRRVHRSSDLDQLLDHFLERAAEALVPGGRLVWVSPLPRHTARAAKDAGLAPYFQKDVDMGGFEAQIQGFRKLLPKAEGGDRGAPFGRRPRP